ncbi:hypothetical protein TREMEDRAFT_58204 [Tremella mesenterica DSM 1558]|uniref:uncharacterized protein n=1 Tax=Tremella mesenterica (strain ATCC 24925 / CBS 8224 / DSM 1558 / NBRC 9311 / NRRL Y-6157 / RJB 2259-6 / UBC 559-6) TaxID=578456 RepID=UPI0003F499BE|nr:uncharacterized protein TREMEDRAFT_58204 [Tremella mesenterica DSM 1558]EIW72054.1 hypothetical protein TREMEDRAFT_58204 [Tremella mesenterica DSM 1558]
MSSSAVNVFSGATFPEFTMKPSQFKVLEADESTKVVTLRNPSLKSTKLRIVDFDFDAGHIDKVVKFLKSFIKKEYVKESSKTTRRHCLYDAYSFMENFEGELGLVVRGDACSTCRDKGLNCLVGVVSRILPDGKDEYFVCTKCVRCRATPNCACDLLLDSGLGKRRVGKVKEGPHVEMVEKLKGVRASMKMWEKAVVSPIVLKKALEELGEVQQYLDNFGIIKSKAGSPSKKRKSMADYGLGDEDDAGGSGQGNNGGDE